MFRVCTVHPSINQLKVIKVVCVCLAGSWWLGTGRFVWILRRAPSPTFAVFWSVILTASVETHHPPLSPLRGNQLHPNDWSALCRAKECWIWQQISDGWVVWEKTPTAAKCKNVFAHCCVSLIYFKTVVGNLQHAWNYIL